MMDDSKPGAPVIAVFHAEDPELLPIAESLLEQNGIEYLIRSEGTRVPVAFGHRAEFGGSEGPADICVRADDVARALELLADLSRDASTPAGAPAQPVLSGATASSSPRPYVLTEAESGAVIGEITERQRACLIDELEEESVTDRDYYIDAATIDMLESAGAGAELLAMLRQALGTRDGVEVRWSPAG